MSDVLTCRRRGRWCGCIGLSIEMHVSIPHYSVRQYYCTDSTTALARLAIGSGCQLYGFAVSPRLTVQHHAVQQLRTRLPCLLYCRTQISTDLLSLVLHLSAAACVCAVVVARVQPSATPHDLCGGRHVQPRITASTTLGAQDAVRSEAGAARLE